MFLCYPHRRLSGVMLILGYAIVHSYTSTFGVRRSRVFSGNALLSLCPRGNEKDILSSLRYANSTEEVDHALQLNCLVNDATDTSTSIPLNESTFQITLSKIPTFSINITAAALRKLAQLSMIEAKEHQNNVTMKAHRKDLLKSLLKAIGTQVLTEDQSEEKIGVYALADILQGTAILASTPTGNPEAVQPFCDLVIQKLTRYDTKTLYWLGPMRLIQTLLSLSKLPDLNGSARLLTERIYDRLLKPDAVSKLPPRALVQGLRLSGHPKTCGN